MLWYYCPSVLHWMWPPPQHSNCLKVTQDFGNSSNFCVVESTHTAWVDETRQHFYCNNFCLFKLNMGFFFFSSCCTEFANLCITNKVLPGVFFFFFPELAQRKCFRAGRRLTWPAPPHRPSQVPELNLVTFCFCCRKVNCLPFPRCWKPPTLISHSPHGCWAPAAAQNIDRTERISDETSSSRCIRHEGRTPEALLEEDFHNKSPVGERVHQAKPTKSPENVHV